MKVVKLNGSCEASVEMQNVRFHLDRYLTLCAKIFTLLVVTLLIILKYTTTTNVVAAIVLVFVSLLWVLKTLNNLPAFLMASFILYVNYSVAVGEFLTTVPTSCPLNEVSDVVTYGTSIRLILIFITIVALFYRPRSYSILDDSFSIRNDFIFLAIFLYLMPKIILSGFNLYPAIFTPTNSERGHQRNSKPRQAESQSHAKKIMQLECMSSKTSPAQS
jgi:hypothetical protein